MCCGGSNVADHGVRLRKRDQWALPKGRLDASETARAAAEREVLEETGHSVSVQEFLETLVYESRGRSKVVHYWRMEAGLAPVRNLMRDVEAVDWLPLDRAVERLSRDHERAFLANVGPLALAAAPQGLADADTPADPALEPAIIDMASEDRTERRSFVQRVKNWLRRAA